MSSLHFVLTAAAAQRVHEALVCLSKFSEYICLEARHNRLTLSALNSTKSAYGAVALSSARFFEQYQFEENSDVDADGDGSRFTCQLYSKALLAAFRQRYSDAKDRSTAIQKCEVSFQDDPSQPQCRLLVKLICKHGVLKTYKLTYEEVDVMAPVFEREQARNRWTISSRLMMEYMGHFGPKAEQFDVSSNNGRTSFTSFTEGLMAGKEILKMAMHTNIALDTSDFELWDVEDRIHVAVSLKDMKAIITHASSLNASLSTFYGDPGRPLQAAYEYDGMKCEFTLMTMANARAPKAFAAIANVENRPSVDPITRSNSAFLVSQRREPSRAPTRDTSLNVTQVQARALRQSPQLRPPIDDEPLFRGPTPTFEARPSASAQRTQMPPPSPPSPPHPSPSQIPPSRPMTQGLFLPFDSDEDSDDDDLGRRLDNWEEPMLRWDSGRSDDVMPSISVVRDQVAPQMRLDRADEAGSGEESEGDSMVVGPTQEVSQARGLFDF